MIVSGQKMRDRGERVRQHQLKREMEIEIEKWVDGSTDRERKKGKER